MTNPSLPSPARRILLAALGSTLVLGRAARAQARNYPDQPVRLVVPYPPGGATDVIGRVLAQALSDKLGQPFVVDNRSGAGGSVGAGLVAKSRADGYTLLMGAFTSHAINAALQPGIVSFDIEKSFAPISIVGTVPLVFVVHPELEADSLSELIALAKRKPGSLTFASAGTGSPQHLATELFERTAGVDVLHVPYKGSGPAMTDLIGGQVQAMIETAPAAQAHVKSGKLRALATTTEEPVASLPGVPTAAQAGLPDFTVRSMFAIAAPAGTPSEIIDTLNATLAEILANPAVKEQLLAQGVIATHTSPQEAAKAISTEYAKWLEVIEQGNIVVE